MGRTGRSSPFGLRGHASRRRDRMRCRCDLPADELQESAATSTFSTSAGGPTTELLTLETSKRRGGSPGSSQACRSWLMKRLLALRLCWSRSSCGLAASASRRRRPAVHATLHEARRWLPEVRLRDHRLHRRALGSHVQGRPRRAHGATRTCPETPTCRGTDWSTTSGRTTILLPWQACLTQQQAQQINGLTPGFVERAFKRLSWPSSELVVQPPNGKTLVNFDTNFYTTNTQPSTRTVTLLGQRVTVEATPTQYTWHFGGRRGRPQHHRPRRRLPGPPGHPPLSPRRHRPAQRRHDVLRPLPRRQRRLADHPRHPHRARTRRSTSRSSAPRRTSSATEARRPRRWGSRGGDRSGSADGCGRRR